MQQTKSENNYLTDINPVDVWGFPKHSPAKQRKHYTKESLSHPAKMPVFLTQKLIKEYSKPGDLILDPMAGIGTTLIEAALLGRNAIGVEYEEKFLNITKRNIQNLEIFRPRNKSIGRVAIIQGDSRQLEKVLEKNLGPANIANLPHKPIDSVITSPPFTNENKGQGLNKSRVHSDGHSFGNIAGVLSEDCKNIDNIKGETYLEAMLKVYQGCFSVLKPGGLMALVTKNFVRAGKMMRLDLDTILLCEKAGFSLLERKFHRINHASFWIRNARKKWYQANPDCISGDPYAGFEDILIFKKKTKVVQLT